MLTNFDDGFTLTELLVTVMILGILATVAVLSLGSSRQSSVQSSCRTAYQGVVLAISTYQSDHAGSLPASINALTASDSATGVTYLSAGLLPTEYFRLGLDTVSATALAAPEKYIVTVSNTAGVLQTSVDAAGKAPAACGSL